jgi:nucleotide-binding universal stress UspA family protein
VLQRILVPLDGSACADFAFGYALRLAKADAAALYMCSVDGAEGVLEAAVQKATSAGVPAGKHVRFGDPGPAIVACAAEMRADVIVMGTHGRSSLKHPLVGSVAEHVLRTAPCPVVAVREQMQ